jgi:hypothetical protein
MMDDPGAIYYRSTSADRGAGASAAPTDDEFRQAFGESLRDVLDLRTWTPGRDLGDEYRRIEQEVREGLADEDEAQRRIRRNGLALLADPATAPPHGGAYQADLRLIPRVHRGLLFNGGVECCDATVHTHDTLPLTVHQIGVSLVSYRGDQGTWQHRLFRRDLRRRGDPLDDFIRGLERRAGRAALNHGAGDDTLGELARRAVMDYSERAVLLRHSKAIWRMGHGNPVPYELLTGAGMLELMVTATTMLRELIERKKFVFVSSEPRDRLLLTIGQSLGPMQYAVVESLDTRLRHWLHQRRFAADTATLLDWAGEVITPAEWIPRFLDRVASRVLVGVFRASRHAPAHVFYAHADDVHLAAHIVLADSRLQDHRGFPLLIDLADRVCGDVFGGRLQHLTESAYAAAGAPWRYFSERTTRGR